MKTFGKSAAEILTAHPVGVLAGKFRGEILRLPRSSRSAGAQAHGFSDDRRTAIAGPQICAGLDFRRSTLPATDNQSVPTDYAASRFSSGSRLLSAFPVARPAKASAASRQIWFRSRKNPRCALAGAAPGVILKVSVLRSSAEKLAYDGRSFKRKSAGTNLPPSHPGRATKHETRNEHGNEK